MLPEKTEETEGGVRLYFPTEAVGMLAFDAVGTKGDALILRYGEELSDTLAALKTCGEYELCRELATDGGAWLNMIKEGATLTYEAWGKDQKWNTSLCHPWATAPLIIFADTVIPY
jgi:hypothetical protein